MAKKLNRKSIGIDISEEYVKICIDRLKMIPEPLFKNNQ
jgi:DNA modification methylase